MDADFRPSGIEGLGDVSWGTHFCLFYETKEDLLGFFIPYFRAGLEHHEFCLCIASEPLIVEEAERAMRQAIPDFERYLAKGQIEIISHLDWKLRDGRFDRQHILQGWIDKLEQALTKGFSGVRFAANNLFEKADWESFARYEEKLEQVLHNVQIEGLCVYNLNYYFAGNVLDILRHHQFALARRNGTWEVLEGSQLKRAHEEILKLNAELEQRVGERTAELAAVNEQLRREIDERTRSEARLQAAIEAADIVLWESDLPSGRFTWLGHSEKVYGLAPSEYDGTLGGFEKLVHPEDIEELRRKRQHALEQRSEYSHEYRVIWQDGSTRWARAQGRFIYNEAGQPVRLYGAVLDITERKQAEETIRKSEQLLREAESLGHTGSWEKNLVTGEIFHTQENRRLFFGDQGNSSKITFLVDYNEAIHPNDREYVMQSRVQLLTEGGPRDIEFRVVLPDGSVHIIFSRATVVYDELGHAIRVYGTNIDITERKQAEDEIRRQAARAETLARIAASLNKQLDLEAVIHAVCQEAVDTFKVSQAIISLYDAKRDLLYYAGGVNIPPQYGTKIESVSRAQLEEFVRTMGTILVVPDIQALPNVPSAEFTFDLNVRTVVTADMRRDHELIGVLVLGVNNQVRDFDKDELSLLRAISDQAAIAIANALLLKRANEQHEQLRALSTRLVQVQETERRALTMELHDRVGQNLTGLSILLQNIKALLPQEAAKILAAEFEDAQILVQDTTHHIRDIMAELYLPELEDHGLAAALETYAERAAAQGNLDLDVDLPEPPLLLSSDLRVALFRAAQEAISNILKHADATQLEIRLERENGTVRLSVADNGQGFEPGAASRKETPSWGLRIMRERIESIGGRVEIESEPGQGTRVTFEIERSS